MASIDDLLERDKQREKDGFRRKIRIGRLIKPGRGSRDKVVVVPTTTEDKFLHDTIKPPDEESPSGGTGEGEEGEVIGEIPIHDPNAPGQSGAGQGKGEAHEVESNAYDLGRTLTEKFKLPNLQDKGKKRIVKRIIYDLTDRHKGSGQVLDKGATIREIVKTNIPLGNIPDVNDIDPAKLLVAPKDKVYRTLYEEREYESQALVFFVRDYSGSMYGKPTELVVAQHVLIYSWLLYQYERLVETRFIVHDTAAKEVPDFYTYYNSRAAGGTNIFPAFELVNEIVEKENLARDYNIYMFYGTDGDDWESEGERAVAAMETMLTYVSRAGLTVIQTFGQETIFEKYIMKLVQREPSLLKLHVLSEGADETQLIEGIKHLVSP